MRAVVYDQYEPTELEWREVDDPLIGPDWILVDVRAASVNPVDWKVASGGLAGALDTFFPVVPGWDVSGVVASVGPAVTGLEPGDEVFGYVRKDAVHGGTYAEKVGAPYRCLARKPSSLSFAEAAAVPLAGLTAYQSLVHKLDVSPGDVVLVHAAAGGVGAFAVQIALSRGAQVIGTASSDNHDFLRELGAEPVEYGDGLVERVHEITHRGVDAIFDPIGGETLALTPQLLSPESGGRVVSIADAGVKDLGGHYVFVTPDRADLEALAVLADEGMLRVHLADTFPMARAMDAWKANQSGHTRGKIALVND